MAEGDEIVTFRLAPADRRAIARLVEAGEYRSRSEFLRHAIKTALRDLELRGKVPLDLELEGVDITRHAAPASARSRPQRNRMGQR